MLNIWTFQIIIIVRFQKNKVTLSTSQLEKGLKQLMTRLTKTLFSLPIGLCIRKAISTVDHIFLVLKCAMCSVFTNFHIQITQIRGSKIRVTDNLIKVLDSSSLQKPSHPISLQFFNRQRSNSFISAPLELQPTQSISGPKGTVFPLHSNRHGGFEVKISR